MAVRRWHARRLRRGSAAGWPIQPSTGQRPADWPGWPGAHRFACVLTHDVEGSEGLARVRRLAELEMSLGFRSSFNFIPEGEYSLPEDLLGWLVENGFEVGVHDLHHDGSLYRGRSGFRRRAAKINRYLRDWKAVGFRSGFMLNNLEWLHDLDIQYDASTFDTDPFEPQPGGAGTIFPFWVAGVATGSPGQPGPVRPGYVELPYTLPQDSTLFLLLREPSPELWLRKLDWVVGQGGMALVNVHPDYLRFADEPPSQRTYPVEHYVRLLQAVRDRGTEAWHARPRDVAAWYSRVARGPRPADASGTVPTEPGPVVSPPTDTLRHRRVAVLLYSCYPSDSRPRRAAEALVAAGAEVDLIGLQENPRTASREIIAGVRVTRVPLRQRRGGRLVYAFQYALFFAWSGLLLTGRTLTRRYDVVHVHNMPDFLVWAAWVPKLRGARVILDLHDPMPELFMSLYRRDRDNYLIRVLCEVERLSIAFAHLVLTPNESFRQRFVSRSGAFGKVHVVMNSPEEEIFNRSAVPPGAPGEDDPSFRLMYHGLIAERHGLDLLVEALAIARQSVPQLTLDIFGAPTPYLDEVLELASRRGVSGCITCHGMVTESVIAANIDRCDLGIVPNRWSPFIAINLPTRIFEYLVMGRLVVVPATIGIQDYFAPEDLLFFMPDDPADLARQIIWAHAHPERAREVTRRGQAVYQRHRWHKERQRLLELVANLLSPPLATTISS